MACVYRHTSRTRFWCLRLLTTSRCMLQNDRRQRTPSDIVGVSTTQQFSKCTAKHAARVEVNRSLTAEGKQTSDCFHRYGCVRFSPPSKSWQVLSTMIRSRVRMQTAVANDVAREAFGLMDVYSPDNTRRGAFNVGACCQKVHFCSSLASVLAVQRCSLLAITGVSARARETTAHDCCFYRCLQRWH